MARPTPTNTSVRNYAIGLSLSFLLLFSDINYGTFSPLRGFLHASTLYAQMISKGVFENISMTLTSIQKNKSLSEENKELRDQILKMRTKDFISRKNNENNTQIINFQNDLTRSLKNDDPYIYKIASVDLRNYLCCSTHRIFLKNTNEDRKSVV